MLSSELYIHETESVKSALKKLDKTGKKVLLVVDSARRLLGTITDGDIRRYILKGKGLDDAICDVYNRRPAYMEKNNFTKALAKEMFIKNDLELIPIINKDKEPIEFILWNEVFSKGETGRAVSSKLDIPVVIMAGGRGERLEPFNRILPKPLLPIGDKPIAEIIIDEFLQYGIKQYYFTLNYKAEMIESYFNSKEKEYNLMFKREKDYYGTAGSLKLLEDEISDIFIVSNCDVIVKADYGEVLDFHKSNDASLTVLSAIQHHKIPYGVIKFKEKGEVIEINEKPEYTFTVNTGVYILNKRALKLIPSKACFDMTDLIKALIGDGQKVLTYPVNENDYMDIGQWEEYKKSFKKLNDAIKLETEY